MLSSWGVSTLDSDRAWLELETLFSGQWDNGMVPHIIFHNEDEGHFPGPDVWNSRTVPPTGGISQPPIAATFVRKIFEFNPDAGRHRLEALFPKLLRWHAWFQTYRSAGGRIVATHPWESGRDNSPDWDRALASVDASGVGEYSRRDILHVDSDMRPRKEDYDRYLAILIAGRESGWDEDWIRERGPFREADPRPDLHAASCAPRPRRPCRGAWAANRPDRLLDPRDRKRRAAHVEPGTWRLRCAGLAVWPILGRNCIFGISLLVRGCWR